MINQILFISSAYLIGSLSFGIIISKFLNLKDPRTIGSKNPGATNVLTQDIRGISTQIIELNEILEQTKNELENLKKETSHFDETLDDASSNLENSVNQISTSIENVEEGSSQLNALLFPIVASIAIILALQIVIIARRR